MNEQLYGAIAAALQMPQTEFIAALKDGENFLPDTEIPAKVQELVSGRLKAAKTEQLKRGVREASSAFERKISEAGFKPEDSELKGVDLLAAFIDSRTAQPSADPATQPTKEDLAKMPLVQSLVNEAKQAAAAKLEAITNEYSTFKQTAKKDQINGKLAAIAPDILKKADIAFDVDGVDKTARLNALFSLLPVSSMDLDASGNLVVMQDGAMKTDDFGKPVTVEQIIVGAAKPIFGERKQNPSFSGGGYAGGSAGAPGTNPGSAIRFADANAFNQFMGTETDGAKRAEGAKAWATQLQEKAAG